MKVQLIPKPRIKSKMSYNSSIIPIQVTNFVLADGREVDPCTTSRRKLINAVRTAFVEKDIADFNKNHKSAIIKNQVLNFSSKQFRILNVKPSNKSYKPIAAKIAASIESEQPMSISGINSDCSEIVIYLFQTNYPKYCISKGDVFVDARIPEKDENSVFMDICIFIQILLEYIVVIAGLFLLGVYCFHLIKFEPLQIKKTTLEAYQNIASNAYLSVVENIPDFESIKAEVVKIDLNYLNHLRNLKMVNDLVCYLTANNQDCNKK
jgi:hypothetical protein